MNAKAGGPLLEQKMQQIGGEIISMAIGCFTACTSARSLLETTVAVKNSAAGGVRVCFHQLIQALSDFKTFSNVVKKLAAG